MSPDEQNQIPVLEKADETVLNDLRRAYMDGHRVDLYIPVPLEKGSANWRKAWVTGFIGIRCVSVACHVVECEYILLRTRASRTGFALRRVYEVRFERPGDGGRPTSHARYLQSPPAPRSSPSVPSPGSDGSCLSVPESAQSPSTQTHSSPGPSSAVTGPAQAGS